MEVARGAPLKETTGAMGRRRDDHCSNKEKDSHFLADYVLVVINAPLFKLCFYFNGIALNR